MQHRTFVPTCASSLSFRPKDVKTTHRSFRFFWVVLWLAVFNSSFAQSPFESYSLLTAADGLPGNNLSFVLEDSDGFIWIACPNGLSRYDGQSFQNTVIGSGEGQMRGKGVRWLLNIDSLHILAGTDAGISKINIRNFQAASVSFKAPEALLSKTNLVQQMMLSKRGNIWVVTTAAVHLVSPALKVLGTWFFPEALVVKAGNLQSSRLWEFPDGKIWVVGPQVTTSRRVELVTVFEIDPTHKTMDMVQADFICEATRYLSLMQVNDTLGFLSYENLDTLPVMALYNLKNHSIEPLAFQPFRFQNYLPFLSAPELGKIGMSTFGASDYYLFDWRSKTWEFLHIPIFQLLKSVVKTKSGVYIAATESGLLRTSTVNSLMKPELCIETLKNSDKSKSLFMEAMIHSKAKTVMSTTFDGLVIHDEQTGDCRQWKPKHPVHEDWNIIYNIIPLQGDSMLVAGFGAYLADLQAEQTSKLPGKDRPVFMDSLTATTFQDSRGDVWFGVIYSNGIVRYEPRNGRFVHYALSGKYAHLNFTSFSAIMEDLDGNMWFGSAVGSGLLRWDRARDTLTCLYPDLNSPSSFRSKISAFARDPAGNIWIGSEGYGVFRFHPHEMKFKNFNISTGLPNDYITALAADCKGYVWIGSVAGLCRLDPKTGNVYQFFRGHGLPDTNINAISMVTGDSCTMFVSTTKGFRLFDVNNFSEPPPDRRIFINSLKVNGKEAAYSPGTTLRLRYNENNIEVTFSQLNLLDGYLNRYAYKFSNLDGNWINIDNQNVLRLTALGAGAYDVQLRVCVNGGACFEKTLLKIFVRRPFWETPLFYTLLASLLLGVVAYYLFTRYRTRIAALERERETERLRTSIAQDIHDEVGATLTKISLTAQVAARLPHLDEAEMKERLEKLGADARNAAGQLREIVFAINPDFDRFGDMQAYFRENAREFWSETAVEPHFDFEKNGDNPLVSPNVKRQLLLIFKEAQNNTAKHGCGSEVHLTFRLTSPDRYLLEVRDNGQGFFMNETRQFSSGLSGMRRRAESIGAVFSMQSLPGKGTMVRVEGIL